MWAESFEHVNALGILRYCHVICKEVRRLKTKRKLCLVYGPMHGDIIASCNMSKEKKAALGGDLAKTPQ